MASSSWDTEKVDVDRLAVDRVARQLLDHDGRRSGAIDAEVKHRACVGEGEPQLTAVDLKRRGGLTAAVDDTGNLAGSTQTPNRPRTRGFALRN